MPSSRPVQSGGGSDAGHLGPHWSALTVSNFISESFQTMIVQVGAEHNPAIAGCRDCDFDVTALSLSRRYSSLRSGTCEARQTIGGAAVAARGARIHDLKLGTVETITTLSQPCPIACSRSTNPAAPCSATAFGSNATRRQFGAPPQGQGATLRPVRPVRQIEPPTSRHSGSSRNRSR